MMEPSNLDLHQQLQELHGSSPLAASYFHLVGGSHEWSQNLLLNGDNITQDINGLVSSSRDFIQSHETPLPPLSTPMVQDLGFHWGGKAEAYMSHSTNQTTLAQIKEELSDSSTIEDYHMPSTSCIKPQQQGFHELDEKLLTTTFSSGCQMNSLQPPVTAGDLLFHATSLGTYGEAPPCGRGNFSMVLPSTNISSLSQQPLSFPSSLGMDLQALDLIAAARFGKKISQPSLTSIPLLRKGLPYGLGCLQGLSQGLSNSHIKMPSLMNGVTETKRSNSLLEHKASQAVPKKQRLESHSSFSPFKVRKEKLGDRIAALQQLVAPFGKTDTASVLLEAIGYIKFLQDQVETLSVPYMGASSSKKLKATKEATSEETDEPKLDLRSKGLCLVPLSCTSYVTNESGGIWSSPNFRAGT